MFPFEVDPTSDLPLWVQLRNRIAYLINDGTLAPGDKLPTVRGLASEISINYNTVNKAYLSLVSDGYLESTRGRGVFVTDLGAKMGAEGEGEADAVLDECIASCRELGMGLDDIERAMSRKIKRLKYDEARERGEVPLTSSISRSPPCGPRRGRDSSRLPPLFASLTAPNDAVPQVPI